MSIISVLIQAVIKLFMVLVEFLVIVGLGLLAALLFLTPWLLRAAAILSWLATAYMAISVLHVIYSPFSETIPLIALKFAVILLVVSWMGALLHLSPDNFWGGLAAGSLVMGGAAIGASWLSANWRYADLFFRAVPPTLFSVLLFYETIRVRAKQRNKRTTNKVVAIGCSKEVIL